MDTAIATPAIFPRPTVADKAAVRAWKCVTSPSASLIALFSLVFSSRVSSTDPGKFLC